MKVLKCKSGLVNVVISLLIVLLIASMFVPSVEYARKEDAYECSVYGYVFMLTDKPYRYLTDAIEDGEFDAVLGEGAGENYSVNDCFSEPMLILLLGVVCIVISFYGYKHWFPCLTNIVWAIIAIKGAVANPIVALSSLQTLYLVLPIIAAVLVVVNFLFTTVLKKKEVEA